MGRAIHWRCFHCGDTFTKAQERWAREHFGRDESAEPVCLMRVPGEGSLLTALRNAQDELERYRAEDSDLMRALYAMRSDHASALRDEEERGYAKGVSDARAESAALVTAAREVDRWALVIESAVRQDAPRDHAPVVAALKANSATLEAFP